MSTLESLILLLLAAVLLLQGARLLALPYPGLLAIGGLAVASIPDSPIIVLAPQTALALFVAPALFGGAYQFPIRIAGALWRPLLVLAGGAVLATTAVVAWIASSTAGLPIAAGVVLGAIVAPPDAVAVTAVLGVVSLPRSTTTVLQGESLFNDAMTLLLFSAALGIEERGMFEVAAGLQLAVAVPGGVLLGYGLGLAMWKAAGLFDNTLGGNVLQFLTALVAWIVAHHLRLSEVLTVVACAMTLANTREKTGSTRMRVQSSAVWATVVFMLNIFAFLLMGMQARVIVGDMSAAEFWLSGRIVALIVLAIVVVRFAVVLVWVALARQLESLRGGLASPTFSQGVAVSWSGMRGVVTLATAFALPAQFPQRDFVVLTAFGVVLATLILQGMTLTPLIRWLKLDRFEDSVGDIAAARRKLASIGLRHINASRETADMMIQELYRLIAATQSDPVAIKRLEDYRKVGLGIVAEQRDALAKMRDSQQIDMDGYELLQEEIDWHELSLLPDSDRQIEET